MERIAPFYPLLLALCGCGAPTTNGDGEVDADAPDLLDADGREGDAQTDAVDVSAEDESLDGPEDPGWTWYEGEVPHLPRSTKADHLASCMRSRACSTSPQQLGTCGAAFAHIQGRMLGIVLGSVARCVAEAPADCGSVTDCLTNGEGPTTCEPLVTPDRCDGSVLRQCSRASGVDLVVDCAPLGLECYIDDEGTATCGLGICDPATFRPDCHGDTLVICESGVVTVAQCDAAGLACVQEAGMPGVCAGGGEVCTAEEDPRRCDGDLIVGCIGGTLASVDCQVVVSRWTCGPRDGTFGCVPSGDECTADPLFGTDVDESCGGDEVVFCLDGYISSLSCSDYGMGSCTDLGMAARCTPP